ncbi:uncharacterized protein KGF55_005456 [Candida pseudojiufengensis]|uniref:uncharacterized protein n=1 Tax=Candida pseudojiufengensis TaxID=497109 RepID=UPI002225169D|nr:uncharacterized protein KGF55_005456 [Candida pseudojiufengensis]KAI5959306.1 hypothetical protein KGF55_005456 [Candida pseudojiufengensis]
MRLIWLSLIFVQLVSANYGFEEWSNNDLKQFLKDLKIKEDPSWDNSKLIEIANNEAKKLENGYNKLKIEIDKQLKPKKSNLEDYLNFSYLFGGNKKDTKQSIKDWFFESWDLNSLQKYLKHNGITYDPKANKSDLLKEIKSSYDKIAKKNHGSSYYPGNWLYDSWSNDDLTNWLNRYGIEYNKKSTKDQLIDKVKEFNYKATNDIIDTKDALFDSLDLFDKSIFDKTGQIKNEFFETWSYSQLREWLFLHGFINVSPDEYVADLDKDELIKKAQEYKKYLLQDIQTWLQHAEKKHHPFLSKDGDSSTSTGSNKKKGGVSNLINDTFFVGIDNWSKDKLREFLNVRKVPYSIFTTRQQLVDLVKEHNADPIHVEADAYIVDNDVSTNSIKQWLIEQGQNIEGSRQDLITAFQEQFKKSGSGSNNIESQIRFYAPDLNTFKHYLNKNVPESENYSENKIKHAFKLVEEYFNKASETARDEFKKEEYSVEDALQEIQKSSYEYAVGLSDEIDDHAKNLGKLIVDAKLASSNYVKSLTRKLIKDWKKIESSLFGGKSSKSWLEQGQEKLSKGGQQVLKNVDDHIEELGAQYGLLAQQAKDIYDDYLSTADDSVDDLSKQAGIKYEEAAKDANEKYTNFQKLVNKKADNVAEAAGKQYEIAVKDANKKYEEYQKLFNKKLDELTNDAGKSYELAAAEASKKFDEYSNLANDAVDDVKKEAGKQYELAAADAEKKYNEYKKLTSRKYQDISKLANKQYNEYSNSINEKANELSKEAAKQYEIARKLANEKYDAFNKLANEKYSEWSKDASNKVDELYKEAGKQYELAAKDASKKYTEYSSIIGALALEYGTKAKNKFNKYSTDLSNEAAKQYEIASEDAAKKYDEFYKLAGKKYEEYSEEALKQLDKAQIEAYKQYENAAKDASIKYDEYKKYAGVKADELLNEAGKQYEYWKKEAGKKANEYSKEAGKQYENLKKDASKKANEWSKEANKLAKEYSQDAQEKIQTTSEEVWDSTHKNYIHYSPKIQDWFKNQYRSILFHLGLFNNKIYDVAEQAKEEIHEKWDSIIKTYSNADLKAYLRSFGYNYNWLSGLNRKELLTLAEAQNKLFSGYKNLKWDKSISDVLKDVGEDIGDKLGIKKHPVGIIEHLKSLVGLNY